MNEYDFEYKPRDLESDRTALMEAKELIRRNTKEVFMVRIDKATVAFTTREWHVAEYQKMKTKTRIY